MNEPCKNCQHHEAKQGVAGGEKDCFVEKVKIVS